MSVPDVSVPDVSVPDVSVPDAAPEVAPGGVPETDAALRLFELPPEQDVAARPVLWKPARPRQRAARSGRRRPAPMLLAVDGNALAHRVWHAVGGDQAPDLDATERFLTVLSRLAGSARPTACVVGFDDPRRSVRRELHPAYKAQRPAKSGQLVRFLDRLPEVLAELGLCVVTPPGLEADDVLGSAADLAHRRGVAATLITGDRDSFALVSQTVNVMLLGNGGSTSRVSPSWLSSRYGVNPAAYADFAALRGDTSDNLRGVKGIGEMTAARLLAAYPSVEAAVADPAGLTRLLGPYLASVMVDQHDVFKRNLEVMRIRTDVALDLDACVCPLSRQAVAEALDRCGLEDLTERVLRGFSALGRAAWRAPLPGS
jgi:DNA polymerase-1